MEEIIQNQKYFESQLPDEKVVLLIRRHFLAILPFVVTASLFYMLGFLLIFVVPLVIPSLVTGFAYNVYILAVSLLFFFNTALLFHNWTLHYLHVAILTDDHFVEIAQSGLFSRKVSQLSLDKIQDVSADQKGMVNTMFNLGTVDLQTAGDMPNFVIELVPDPNGIAQKVMQIEEEYSERTGLKGDGINRNANTVANVVSAAAVPVSNQFGSPEIEFPNGGGETQQPPV